MLPAVSLVNLAPGRQQMGGRLRRVVGAGCGEHQRGEGTSMRECAPAGTVSPPCTGWGSAVLLPSRTRRRSLVSLFEFLRSQLSTLAASDQPRRRPYFYLRRNAPFPSPCGGRLHLLRKLTQAKGRVNLLCSNRICWNCIIKRRI